MNVLVLGSRGQLGSALCKFFSSKKNIKLSYLSRKECDIKNFSKLNRYFLNNKFNFVINCIAFTDVNLAEVKKRECNFINNIYVEYLCKLSIKFDFKIIHFSTDYVFDGTSNIPYSEYNNPNPINYYGLSKYLGDQKIINSKAKYLILRTSGVYDNHSDNFLVKILNNLRSNKDINVVSDQFCNPTPVFFLSKVVYFFLNNFEKHQGCLFNAVPSRSISWYEFSKLIIEKYKKFYNSNSIINPILYSKMNNDVKRPLNSSLDNTKLKNTIDFNIKNCEELFLEMNIND